MRPPSHEFQLRVSVSASASAINRMSSGVPNRDHMAFSGLGARSTFGGSTVTVGAISGPPADGVPGMSNSPAVKHRGPTESIGRWYWQYLGIDPACGHGRVPSRPG